MFAMKVTKLVLSMIDNKQVVVPIVFACAFIQFCEHAHIPCYGGALSSDFTEQIFYTD